MKDKDGEAGDTKQEETTTFEDVYKMIGGFGRFQIFALIVTLFPELPGGMVDFQPVFTSDHHRIQWFCLDQWGSSTDVTSNKEALCSCNGTLNGGTGTIVAEWGLVCDKDWIPDFITSVQMVGLILGDILGMFLNDTIGRKKLLYISGFVTMTGSVASSLAPNYWLYGCARFFCGVGVSIILFLSTIYPMEFLTPKWRTLCGSAGPWSEGVMLLSLLAYYLPAWRDLCLYSALPMLLLFFTYPLLPESPRYLILKGRTEEAREVLDEIARWNKCPPLEPKIVDQLILSFNSEEEVLQEEVEMEENSQQIKTTKKTASSGKFLDCICDWEFMKKTIIFMSSWFTCLLLYYGIGFGARNLSGDPYLNVFYMALGDVVGAWSAIFMSKWLGRRFAFLFYMGIGALCMLNIILMETCSEGMNSNGDFGFVWPIPNTETIFNGFVICAKTMAAASLGIINCFTSESYSTAQRSLGVGASNVAASVAAVVAPQMAYFGSLYKTGPYYFYTVTSLYSTVSILFLRETNGRPLTESVKS